MTDHQIDWDRLRQAALDVCNQAYAPYSAFSVGAAGQVDDGRIVTGCNVENVSYGLTLCAECGLVSDLHRSGGGKLVAVAIVSGSGAPCAPCGRCRQLLFEHGGPDCLVDGGRDGELRTVGDLLPGSFDPDRLAEG
ncbi:MAG: cytidine deaminase [Actinomycetia bacterium]|nr:cytidine deaminase [Actinomycetes bacterium]MCP4223882.1 cytidine deaminase [Actinomycetes bacterium]MCP5030727.1 cytidine deaminase [Actinomycetes bacterium]